jgi:hypothetical protein
MTIRRCIDASDLSRAMGLFEDGVNAAPEGCYEDAKKLSAIFSEVFVFLKDRLTEADIGLKLPNNDLYREFEAVMYGMIRDGNPDATMFPSGEGLGAALEGPAAERVMAQMISNRDFLRAQGVIPPAVVDA